MSATEISNKLLENLNSISSQYGSGDATNDVAFLAFIAAALTVMLFILNMFRKKENDKLPPGFERITSIVGRVEKLEKNVSEFRTEVLRAVEQFRGDSKVIKQDLYQIKKVLLKETDEGGGDAGGGGGDFSIPGEDPNSGRILAPISSEMDAPRILLEEEDLEIPEDESEEVSVGAGLKKTRLGFFKN